VTDVAQLWSRKGSDPILFTTLVVMRVLAQRTRRLNDEIKAPDGILAELDADTAQSFVGLHGVGTDTAATLLMTVGDNAGRLHSGKSWAHLCGVYPIPAGSGKSIGRHTLNGGGDRQANAALHRNVLTRMAATS
jgi:transposase